MNHIEELKDLCVFLHEKIDGKIKLSLSYSDHRKLYRILQMSEVYDFLMKPHSIGQTKFFDLLYKLGLSNRLSRLTSRIITEDGETYEDLWEMIIKLEFLPSRGEIRKMIKNKGLFLNNLPVTENMKLSEEMFYETGIIDDNYNLKFTIMRQGKKTHELLFGYFKQS